MHDHHSPYTGTGAGPGCWVVTLGTDSLKLGSEGHSWLQGHGKMYIYPNVQVASLCICGVSEADHKRTRYTIRSQNCSAPPWALVMKLHSSQENRICPPLPLRKLTSQTLTFLMLQVPGCSSLVKSGWAQSPPGFWETVPHPHLMDKQVNLAFQATWLTLESKDYLGSSTFPGL